jgi:HPt (histidine-containing phosphotransfer) domain-containing protein
MNQNTKYNIPDELLDIIPAYLERRGEDCMQLSALFAKKDFEGIMKIAHKLKGNGSSFGFDHITELGEQLNQAAKIEDQEVVKKIIHEFNSEIQVIKFNLDI